MAKLLDYNNNNKNNTNWKRSNQAKQTRPEQPEQQPPPLGHSLLVAGLLHLAQLDSVAMVNPQVFCTQFTTFFI